MITKGRRTASHPMAPVKALTAATAATAGFCLLLAIVQVRAAAVVRRCTAGVPAGGFVAGQRLACDIWRTAAFGQGGQGKRRRVCGRLGPAASTAVVCVGSECLQPVLVGQQACENRICNAVLPVLRPFRDRQLSCFTYTPVGSAKKHASKTEWCSCGEWCRCKWFRQARHQTQHQCPERTRMRMRFDS
jgi:hypothetical protein